MKFKFVSEMGMDLFDATNAAWRAEVAGDPDNTTESYYDAALSYCQGVVQKKIPIGDGAVCVGAVCPSDGLSASALLVMSHVPQRGHLKGLNLYVKPSLNLANREPCAAELAWIAATAIAGALELTYDKFPASALKIFTAF